MSDELKLTNREQCCATVIPKNIYPRREAQCSKPALDGDTLCYLHRAQADAPPKRTYAELKRLVEEYEVYGDVVAELCNEELFNQIEGEFNCRMADKDDA